MFPGRRRRPIQIHILLLLLLLLQSTSSILRTDIVWYAPFFSGGGYCSEAISYALGLENQTNFRIVQHAEPVKRDFFRGLSYDTRKRLQSLMSRQSTYPTIDICHSTPDVWSPNAHFGWDNVPCPSRSSIYKIGRTMYETNRIPEMWIPRLRRMDEIWVPTRWAQGIFESEIGTESDVRVFVVPEAVDTTFFDPSLVDSKKSDHDAYIFFSVLKFETRKNWKDLLEGFFTEFDSSENVRLVLKTSEFHNERSVKDEIEEFLASKHLESVGRLVLIHEMLSVEELRNLYNEADVFVLPSHGEGWGRPHVEAMSMGLPVIATNWSGCTEYMTEENSLPIPLEGMIRSTTNGHLWAKPSLSELRRLMRWCVENPSEAKKLGERARQDMIELYSPERVMSIVMKRLNEIRLNEVKDDREL